MAISNDDFQVKKFIIPLAGILVALICQFFTVQHTGRHITITSFRYGKEPSVIRCHRGDTLHLNFKTRDTGHSFFLEEFDVDAKVSPSRDDVSVFSVSNPSLAPVDTREVSLVARHKGLQNYLVSRSNYRCHVWCGPMHAFEQGKLIILPNTLLLFSLGCLAAILFLWIYGFFSKPALKVVSGSTDNGRDLLKNKFIRNLVVSRWPQFILTILAMVMIYIVILTTVLGTKVSGRNLGVLLMWAVWLFVLVAVLTPLFGRIWCTICPLPFFGDWFQRHTFFGPDSGNEGKKHGLWIKWPDWLSNEWPKLFVFMVFATFSTTLVAVPFASGITVFLLLFIPTVMALIWEYRAFCRYLCPVSVFTGPFSRTSKISLRSRLGSVCSKCRKKSCKNGSTLGWACPYGLNAGKIEDGSDCGLCLECTRSCDYDNVTIYTRPFANELSTCSLAQAWQTIAIFALAVVYSILYEGHWPGVRDYINIIDKKNWDLFGIYSVIMWVFVLLIVPALVWLAADAGIRLSKMNSGRKITFLHFSGSLLPLGLMLWISFVIPMLFVNITFIQQSLSDPFGWGWDFFGTANIPWHQLIPQYIPWIQAIAILTGLYLSLRNLQRSFENHNLKPITELKMLLPMGIFLIAVAVAGVVFYTN
jgi:polyferredoxin